MLLDNFRTIISTRINPELYSLSIPGLEASLTNGGVFVLVNLPKLLTFFAIKVSLNFKLITAIAYDFRFDKFSVASSMTRNHLDCDCYFICSLVTSPCYGGVQCEASEVAS